MDVIHCFKGRDASLPVCLACCMHELSPGLPWIRAAVLEFQNWGKPLVIAVISLPNYSARLLTCPYPLRLCSCCHFTPHSGWRVLDQQSNLCLLTAKQNSGVRAQVTLHKLFLMCKTTARDMWNQSTAVLSCYDMGFSPVSWSFCRTFCMRSDTLFDFWWSLAVESKQNGQSKAFWWGDICGDFYLIAWWKLCPPCTLFERSFFTDVHPRKCVPLLHTCLCCAEITCYYWVWLV